jgi:DNA-directed RNA polymerase subunit M
MHRNLWFRYKKLYKPPRGSKAKMQFCSKCGSLLVPKALDKKIHLMCPRCGTKKKSSTATLKEKVVKAEEVGEGAAEKAIETRPKTDAECKKCANKEAYLEMRQTRAADEAETRFMTCTKCGHTWREYE